MKLINAGGITPAAHEMAKALSTKYNEPYAAVIERLCVFYSPELFSKSKQIAKERAQIEARAAKLAGKVGDDE